MKLPQHGLYFHPHGFGNLEFDVLAVPLHLPTQGRQGLVEVEKPTPKLIDVPLVLPDLLVRRLELPGVCRRFRRLTFEIALKIQDRLPVTLDGRPRSTILLFLGQGQLDGDLEPALPERLHDIARGMGPLGPLQDLLVGIGRDIWKWDLVAGRNFLGKFDPVHFPGKEDVNQYQGDLQALHLLEGLLPGPGQIPRSRSRASSAHARCRAQ